MGAFSGVEFLDNNLYENQNRTETNDDIVKAVENSTDKSIETLPTITGATNTSAVNTCVPLFLGKHLYAPRVLQQYNTVGGTDGADLYYNILYMAGYRPLDISDIKLGLFSMLKNESIKYNEKIDIKKSEKDGLRFSDMTLEICDGTESNLIPYKVVQENFDEPIYYYKFSDDSGNESYYHLDCFSSKNPQKVVLEFECEGLVKWDNSGKKQNTTVELKAEYSFDEVNWVNFGNIGNNVYDETTGITSITRQQTKTLRYTVSKEFTYQDLYDTNGKYKLANSVIYIRITRMNEQDLLNDNVNDTIKLKAIRTTVFDRAKTERLAKEQSDYSQKVLVNQVPVISSVKENTIRIALKVKATKANKDVVKEFNFIGTSKGRVFTNGEWSSEVYPTSNPASCGLIAMQGIHRGEDTYKDSEIDLEYLGRFYDFCKEKDFECNTVVIKQIKTEDLLKNIYATGRGFRILNGLQQSVMFDEPRTTPVNIINNQNCLNANNSKNLDELPDGYICKFHDKNNFYQETEYIVCFNDEDLTKENLKLEQVEVPFVTDSHQIYKLLKYKCACRKLRREIWSRKLSVDGNLIEVGNLVELQDDTILVGIGNGAEITEVVVEDNYITKIVVDEPFEISDSEKAYGVKIMQADGINEPTVMKLRVVNKGVGLYTELEFESPISVQSAIQPCVYDLVSFGEFSKITIDALCSTKKENSDGTFDFVFVPYDEAIYTADEGTIPEFDSKVTSPTGRQVISFDNDSNYATMNDVDRLSAKVQNTDSNGNTWISNSMYAPITAVKIQGIVYAMNNNTLDENGENPENLACEGQFKNESFFDEKTSFVGTVEKDITETDGDTVILTNASKIKLGGKEVDFAGNLVESMNSIASTNWGLSESQINSNIFD